MFRTCSSFLLILALLLSGVQMALAAAVSVTPSGNGVFIISGSGMDAVGGVDLTVSYDATQLASPAVTQGSLISGAIIAVNTNNLGSIRIAAVSTRPFAASGQIATISFATHTGSGRISVVSSLINLTGSPVPGGGTAVAFDSPATASSSAGFIPSAGVPFSQPSTNTNTTTSGTSGSSSGTTAQTSSGSQGLPGTISLPGDVQPKSDPKPAETAATPTQAEESIPADKPSEPPVEAAPAPKPQKTEPVTMISLKGALENFSTFRGEKTPANLVTLLKKPSSAAIRQEPAFALSDGTTALKITAELKNVAEKSPNFALQGARLVSLAADSATSTWTITALPQAGISQASLTILTDREIIEFPLTLAPPIATVTAAEADFTAFLKDSGAVPPKRDLNGDGRHDYQDDFIYTVNYLSKKGVVGKTAK